MNHLEIPVADGLVDFIFYAIPLLSGIYVLGLITEALAPKRHKVE